MKLAKKICIIVMACLLVLGAVCLAFGIMLDGSITELMSAVAIEAADIFERFFGWLSVS